MRSMFVDWSKAYETGVWEFVGCSVLSEKEQENDPDAGYPMMNFAYPLDYFNGDEKTIRRIVRNTSCTVVYNSDQDQYYLALTGGGMNLSQDIAKAYMLAQGCIEWDFLHEVYTSGPLSVSTFWYRKILRQLKKQLEIDIANSQVDLEKIKGLLKEKCS